MHLQFHVTDYVYVKCFVFKELFISYGSDEKVLSGSKTCKEAEFLGNMELQLELLIRFI